MVATRGDSISSHSNKRGIMKKDRHKGKQTKTPIPKKKRRPPKSLQKQAEIIGLLRFVVGAAFVIQLMVEFGPHTVAP